MPPGQLRGCLQLDRPYISLSIKPEKHGLVTTLEVVAFAHATFGAALARGTTIPERGCSCSVSLWASSRCVVFSFCSFHTGVVVRRVESTPMYSLCRERLMPSVSGSLACAKDSGLARRQISLPECPGACCPSSVTFFGTTARFIFVYLLKNEDTKT